VSNRVKLASVFAVLGLFGMASVSLAQDDACGPRKLSKKLEKPMDAVQKARNAKDWAGMLVHSKEVDAVPVEKTEYDKFWIHELQGVAQANLKQYPEAIAELEAAVASPCMLEADKPGRIKLLMQLGYQSKDYPKAIQYGKQAFATGDIEAGIYLGNAYYITNDFENTRATMRDVVNKLETSGKTPDEPTYRILQSACLQLKDNDCVVEQIEKLVTHYPKPKYWTDMIDALLRASKNDRELLNIMRLADGVDAMTDGAQYIEMAQLSMAQGLPGEAQAVLEKGQQKGAFSQARDKDHSTRLLADAKQAVTLDKSTLDKQDASAKAKPTGDADVKLGAAYLSYGQNDKAIEALQRGLGKGGVKYPDEGYLLLGVAYVRSNNIAEATKAFQNVSKDPGLTRIAKLWLMHTGKPTSATPAG
jgi:tetratricopeptide (TPR) repeat protein